MLSSPAIGQAALGTAVAAGAGVPGEASAFLVVASVSRAAGTPAEVAGTPAEVAATLAEVAVTLAGAVAVIPEAVVAEASL
jgi:hypothetical protein